MVGLRNSGAVSAMKSVQNFPASSLAGASGGFGQIDEFLDEAERGELARPRALGGEHDRVPAVAQDRGQADALIRRPVRRLRPEHDRQGRCHDWRRYCVGLVDDRGGLPDGDGGRELLFVADALQLLERRVEARPEPAARGERGGQVLHALDDADGLVVHGARRVAAEVGHPVEHRGEHRLEDRRGRRWSRCSGGCPVRN